MRECFPGAQQGDGLRFGDAVNEDLAFLVVKAVEGAVLSEGGQVLGFIEGGQGSGELDVVDGFAGVFHPGGHFLAGLVIPVHHRAVGARSDIDEEVAAEGAAADQLGEQGVGGPVIAGGFVAWVVVPVGAVFVFGFDAHFPPPSAFVADLDVLGGSLMDSFGGGDVAPGDEGVGLEAMDFFFLHDGVAVPPHHVDFAVVGEELGDLPVGLGVFFFPEFGGELSTTHQGDESGFLADFLEFVVVAYRRVGEVLELVVGVPVRAGVVEADLDVVFAASINVAFDEVAAVHFLASIPLSMLGGPEAVAIVVAGGEHGVAEAGLAGGGHPLVRVVVFGVPGVGDGEHVFSFAQEIVFGTVFVPDHGPGVAIGRWHGGESPVEEDAEP